MSVKEIKDAIKNDLIFFGIRQTLKCNKKLKRVFIARDTRDETVEKLETADIEFDVLKSKSELAKELNLDFECEVFSIYQGTPNKGKR